MAELTKVQKFLIVCALCVGIAVGLGVLIEFLM